MGGGGFSPLSKRTISAITDVPSPGIRPLPLLALLLRHVPALASNGTLILVLDDLKDVRWDELDRCSYVVDLLLQAGVVVLVVEPTGCVTSLAAVQKVVTTNDFIRLYLTDLWAESRPRKLSARRALAKADPSADQRVVMAKALAGMSVAGASSDRPASKSALTTLRLIARTPSAHAVYASRASSSDGSGRC